jgi:glyoxylase-like metal-dependent hydrolase (beta-lactamase superfamily II)
VTDVDFATGPVDGSLDVQWIHGSPSRRRSADPPIQLHAFDPHTFVLRQSKSVHYEAPFLYLLFGNRTALLLDTGATADPLAFPLRETVDGLIDQWLRERPRAGYELVVAHTHGHGDHVAADGQFAGRPSTIVVGREPEAVREFFGFARWPDESVLLDLGGRVLEVTGIPGHHRASIAVYDPWSGFLLTGDTVYPGRLYVEDMPAFVDSLDRLVAVAESRDVRQVMGCHIEMTATPGRDYPLGTTYQPAEPPLPLTVDRLRAVRDTAREVADRPGPHWRDDFAIFNGPCRAEMLRQAGRTLVARIKTAATRRPRSPA